MKTVLSLCDYTGNMVRPWIEAGYEAICVDLQHPANDNFSDGISRVKADVTSYIPPTRDYAVVFAFPPCTHLATSGARWFKEKGLDSLIEALTVFNACIKICERIGAPYMIENPVSTVSTYWRKPDFCFNPCQYGGFLSPEGDAYTKKTCLWVGNGFTMPDKKPVEPVEGSKMHLVPPGPEQANIRSETPRGFAQAVFEHMHSQE